MSNLYEHSSKWSCCKKITREDDGCCIGAHIEDLDTSNNLNKFSVAVDNNKKVNNLMEQIRKENLEYEKNREKANLSNNVLVLPPGYEVKPKAEQQSLINKLTPDEFETPTMDIYLSELTEPPKEPKETYYYSGHVYHKVIEKDTLSGLVLKYNAKIDQIKKR